MKIYLASFWEPENHGPGRKIGISPSKPKNLQEEYGYDCELCFDDISPGDVYWDYHKAKKAADGDKALLKKAGQEFVEGYEGKLEEYMEGISSEAKSSGKSVFDLIGLEEGDTLLSWERGGNITFRTTTASFLREAGYEVEER